MTDAELQAIKDRLQEAVDKRWNARTDHMRDVPALVAEVERLHQCIGTLEFGIQGNEAHVAALEAENARLRAALRSCMNAIPDAELSHPDYEGAKAYRDGQLALGEDQ